MKLKQRLAQVAWLFVAMIPSAFASDCKLVGREYFNEYNLKHKTGRVGYFCGSSVHFFPVRNASLIVPDLNDGTDACCHCANVRKYIREHGSPLACPNFPDFSARLDGILVSPRGNTPLPFQKLSLTIPGRTVQLITDGKGEFHLPVPDVSLDGQQASGQHLTSKKPLTGPIHADSAQTHVYQLRLELDLTLVQGYVYDKTTHAPIESATVEYPGPAGKTVVIQTDSQGLYRIENVQPSQVNGTIRTFHQQYPSEDQTQLRLSEEHAITREADLFLKLPVIAGEVILHSIFGDEKLANISIKARRPSIHATTQADGSYLLAIPDARMKGQSIQIDGASFPLGSNDVDGLDQAVSIRIESDDVTPGHVFHLNYSRGYYERLLATLQARVTELEAKIIAIQQHLNEALTTYASNTISPDLFQQIVTERMEKKQKPKNWGFVIDTSGSMHGTPLEMMFQMMEMIITLAHPDDTISISIMPTQGTAVEEVATIIQSRDKEQLKRFLHSTPANADDFSSPAIAALASRVQKLDHLILFGDSGDPGAPVWKAGQVLDSFHSRTRISAYCLNCVGFSDMKLWQELTSRRRGEFKAVPTANFDPGAAKRTLDTILQDMKTLETISRVEIIETRKKIDQITDHLKH